MTALLVLAVLQVFGFDVMLDEDYRAWLIEVNTTPALNADTPLDVSIKQGMVTDLMHMIGVVPYDKEEYEQVSSDHR